MVYAWFVSLPYVVIILIISLVATLITTLIYKYTTNQEKLRKTKKAVKDLRTEMNKYKNDQKKMMSIQQEMMSKNMEMMKASFKPMIYTFIPLILLFSWMAGTLAYEPLMPGEAFTITATFSDTYASSLGNITITSIPDMDIQRDLDFVPKKEGLKQIRWVATPNSSGTYQLLFESPTFKETKELLVTDVKDYANPITEYKDSQLESVVIGNAPVRPLGGIPVLGGLNWLWTYIILSVAASIILRKIMNVA